MQTIKIPLSKDDAASIEGDNNRDKRHFMIDKISNYLELADFPLKKIIFTHSHKTNSFHLDIETDAPLNEQEIESLQSIIGDIVSKVFEHDALPKHVENDFYATNRFALWNSTQNLIGDLRKKTAEINPLFLKESTAKP